jgi:predicted nucleic acid-binding protein
MSGGRRVYVLDTSVFVQAARTYYAFDIAPGFWDALLKHAQYGSVLSIDRVREEINVGNDPLKHWVNTTFRNYFQPTKGHTIEAYRRIMKRAFSKLQYTSNAKNEFARADNADAWVVAWASAHKAIVVTQEAKNTNARRTIPIPNVCEDWNLPYVNTFEMMRQLGIRL